MKKKGPWKPDGYIKAQLRRIWRWSPKRKLCLQSRACATCGKLAKKRFADHVFPVVDPTQGFQDWNTYIDRMFNGELQALCFKCHSAKTKKEGEIRRQRKQNEQH